MKRALNCKTLCHNLGDEILEGILRNSLKQVPKPELIKLDKDWQEFDLKEVQAKVGVERALMNLIMAHTQVLLA